MGDTRTDVFSDVRSDVTSDEGMGVALDADAAAYISLVEGAGGTVSGAQSAALDTFYQTGKSEGWYASIKRMYLPIWAVASPNAICMISGISGSFVGGAGVTHSSGYVMGNGSTGYFAPDAGGSLGTLGISGGDSMMVALSKVTDGTGTTIPCGLSGAGSERFQIVEDATGSKVQFQCPDFAVTVDFASTLAGVFVGSATATNDRHSSKRTTGAYVTDGNTTSDTSTLPDIVPYFMARNSNGTATLFSEAELGAYGYGTGITDAQVSSLSLAAKDLWEACTGLTLP
jgi:roadblock/LC7 domain-containing protein